MSEKSYDIAFTGHWKESDIFDIPAMPGVYCVYEGTQSSKDGKSYLRRLIYVGEAENAKLRISTHERWPDWRRVLIKGNHLYFAFAHVAVDRNRIEAAYIYKHKPLLNYEYINRFPFDETTIRTTGAAAFLVPLFSASRTE